ncbi:MAG: hypothetical protein AB7S26_01615 [Sandaracinaceae bacterium]
MIARTGTVRRSRLRLLHLPREPERAGRGPYDPPLLSVAPRTVRWVDADGALGSSELARSDEEVWYRAPVGRAIATLGVNGRLRLDVTFGTGDGAEELSLDLIRIPSPKGEHPYFARWEFGKDKAVLSPKGAGLILADGRTLTIEAAPEMVDAYRAERVVLALENVPNGARVVACDGLSVLREGALVSDIRNADIEKGPSVEVSPYEAFLRGNLPVGFRADMTGFDFGGIALTQGEASADLARFVKTTRGVSWAAVRPIARPSDLDAFLAQALVEPTGDEASFGRTQRGKPGTIALSDGRKFRILPHHRERLPRGTWELFAALVIDADAEHGLLIRIAVPLERPAEPSPQAALDAIGRFLVAFHPIPLSP